MCVCMYVGTCMYVCILYVCMYVCTNQGRLRAWPQRREVRDRASAGWT